MNVQSALPLGPQTAIWVLVHPGASGRLPDLWPEVLNDEADRA
jgi:hypothetical protein